MDYKEKIQKLINGEMIDGIKASEIQIGVLKALFPEFTESEDERIRKEIINFLELPHPQFVGKRDHEKWIAWLEKQDSYYTFEIKKGHWYKCVCDYMPNGSDLIFKHDRLYYCRSDWRLIGEIDERNVKDIGVNGYKSFFRPATNQEIKDWLEKQELKKIEQNPAWSEEDDKYRLYLIEYLEGKTKWETLKGRAINWLKSLKDRVLPKPTEWSEDDTNLREATIGLLNLVTPIDAASWGKSRLDCIDWLKSLRPLSTWKPSLSQLNALGVVAKGNAPDDIEEINSLYNNLKKL